ncbi:MAG: DUF4330 domain-containing protein [Tissierellia bacterium]|nr:DUF4330 domain-containing protein [Tissierellia bacterium]
MKIIDKEGRVFGKISILDLIAVLVLLVLLFFMVLRLSNKEISDVVEGDEVRLIRWEVTLEGRKDSLRTIKIGDKIGEMKKFFDAEVVDIKITDAVENHLDKDGKTVESVNPLMERAVVTVEGRLPYQSHSYKLGKQEIRFGQNVLLESQNYRFKGDISNVEVIE